ncbi:uracil-xanthine permease family protein [Streptomyces sp. NPDC057702]|uniref:uracil-xanthine permease family protein n=1 Tax=unclassified Streptomyces TaxID=2593676 RepID=UPI003699BEB2
MGFGVRWTLHGDGRTPAPGAVVRPDERLSWPRTAGLGAQHVVAMFGASFVAPVLMGLDPNLAIMMSGVATILFLLATRGRVPSYLGCSLAFVGVAAVIRAQGGDSATVTGAILVVGGALLLSGLAVRTFGARVIHVAMPPVVTGAVVMLIGLNLAPVTASTYWPTDQWTALATMLFTGLAVVCLRGFWSRIAIFLGLVFGYGFSWLLDRVFGRIHSVNGGTEAVDHWRLDLSAVSHADWFGLPSFHGPAFDWSAILVALPVVIALIAENVGHVKAVGEMTGDRLDDQLGTAISADGAASMISTAVGGPATTTYSENIGVMAASRVYSTAAYWAAALFALLFGLCPRFGAVVAAIPGGVLGGITVILYGMIGLLGAQIWVHNKVDLRNPLHLVPVAAGLIIGVGNVTLKISDNFELSGIALGTIVVLSGYHVLRALAPAHLREPAPAYGPDAPLLDEGTTAYDSGSDAAPDTARAARPEAKDQG